VSTLPNRPRQSESLNALNAFLEPWAALDAVLNSTPVPTTVLDREGLIRLWNSAAERLFGWSSAEVLSYTHPGVPDEDVAAYREHIQRALSGELIPGAEANQFTKNGEVVVVRLAVAPLRNVGGDIIGVVRTFEDVTNQRRTEESLRAQAALIELTFDALLVREFQSDRIRLWNRGAEELYGYSRAEVIGRVSHEVLRTVHQVPIDEAKRVLAANGRWEGELVHQTKDDVRIVVASRWALERDGEEPKAILETNTDITDRKRHEESMSDLANQKEAFVSAVAHDLKNPLTVVQARVQLMRQSVAQKGLEQEEMLRGLEQVEERVRMMTGLLDEFLDVSRIQLGRKLELSLEPVNLLELARQCLAEEQLAAPDHSLVLEATVGGLTGFWDRARLSRVLINLLSNAIKYSPALSTVVVTVGKEGDWAVVSVRDQGIGIPAEDLPRIFDWFYRGGNAVQTVPGTGIGLAGSRLIIEQHGGTLAAESALNKGSTFTVRLPRRLARFGEARSPEQLTG